MRQKLIFVIPELSKETDSHYWHLYELLQEAGKEADIFLFAETGSSDINKGSLTNIYIQKTHVFPLRILERMMVFFVLALKGYKKIYVHISVFSSILASLVMKLFGGRSYFWYCGKTDIYEREQGRQNLSFRLNLKMIDYLITGNQEMKNYYHHVFSVPEEKIKTLSGWVNIERFQKIEEKKVKELQDRLGIGKRKVILFVHWLSPRKGSRFLPNLIKNTISQRNDVIFIIVGDGPDKKWLQRRLRTSSLSGYVNLIGKISNIDIPLYFHLADIFILPSREEELGRVQLEAMAAGLPVVAFASEGSRSIFAKMTDNLLVEDFDTEQFARAIISGLRHRKRFVSANVKEVKKYSLSQVVPRFLQVVS